MITPEERDRIIAQLNLQLDALQIQYDATILAAAMTMRSAWLWQALIALGSESQYTVRDIYQTAMNTAAEPVDRSTLTVVSPTPCSTTRQ